MSKPSSLVLLVALLGAGAALAEFGTSYLVPLDHEAIQYAKTPVDDPIARLGRRIANGEVKLEFENNGMGHLRSLLKNLGVAIDSQVLVFSQTSFQAPRISPGSPRAIYFGDNVSVGWVRGGEVLELAEEFLARYRRGERPERLPELDLEVHHGLEAWRPCISENRAAA